MTNKISFLFIALIMTISSIVIAQKNYNESIKDFMKIASERIQQKDYKGALENFDIAINICPDCSEPHFQKAMMYADLKDFKRAEKEIKAGGNINPESIKWYSIVLKSKKGLEAEAIKDAQYQVGHAANEEWVEYWKKLLHYVSNAKLWQVQAFIFRAGQKQGFRDYIAALNIYDSAIAICSTCDQPHYYKAMVYADMKNFIKADEEYALGEKNAPKSYLKDYCAIQLKLKKGNLEEAFSNLQKMIDKDTAHNNVFYWLKMKADMELKYRKYADAYKDNCRLYKMSVKKKYVLIPIILHELHNKMNEQADAHFKELTQDKSYDTTNYNYGISSIYFYKKDYSKALDYINKTISLTPTFASAWVDKAMIKTLIDSTGDYLEYANKGIKLSPMNSGLWNNRGFTKIIMGKYADAITDIFKAIELDAFDPQPYNNLGYIYYRIGGIENYTLALYNYDKAIELGGGEFDPYWKYRENIEKNHTK